ncbi:MAG TPA: hypothetical protein VLC10_02260 [Patescibacteria group bacterium]|nr:hypothetical protein [Patescibacteria group bacterium]
MRRTLPLILLAALLGVLQASFVRALPHPASAVDLPLILIVALVTNFRFADAFVAAAAAGLSIDALSSLPFGTNAAILLVLAAVTVGLFARVFTNHSWPGTVGINVAVYALANVALAAVRVVRATFVGFPMFPAIDAAAFSGALAAIAVQLAAALLAVGIGALAKKAFSRFFFLR